MLRESVHKKRGGVTHLIMFCIQSFEMLQSHVIEVKIHWHAQIRCIVCSYGYLTLFFFAFKIENHGNHGFLGTEWWRTRGSSSQYKSLLKVQNMWIFILAVLILEMPFFKTYGLQSERPWKCLSFYISLYFYT